MRWHFIRKCKNVYFEFQTGTFHWGGSEAKSMWLDFTTKAIIFNVSYKLALCYGSQV